MQSSDFAKAAPGRLEGTSFVERRGPRAVVDQVEVAGLGFVPDPLPSGLTQAPLAGPVQDDLLAAERNLNLLEGLARNLDNPAMLIGPFQSKEAKHSSAIENTFASGEQLVLFDPDPTSVDERERPEVREVANYLRALRYGFESSTPISLRLIREMHAILLDGATRSAGKPGAFRTRQNAIGDPSGRFADAVFVPSPPRFIDECLTDLEAYIHAPSELPRLVRFALVHYQFETIHPFDDGNGRLGRLLIALQLCDQAQLSLPLVYVSGFSERHRSEYYRLLHDVSTHGAWVEWINFFLRAVATQADDALRRSEKLLALRKSYVSRVREKRASALLAEVVDMLFREPAVTIARVADATGTKPQSAGRIVKRLVEHGILSEATGRKSFRVFLAHEILTATHEPLGEDTA